MIHGVRKLSVSILQGLPQKVGCGGMLIVPPSARA